MGPASNIQKLYPQLLPRRTRNTCSKFEQDWIPKQPTTIKKSKVQARNLMEFGMTFNVETMENRPKEVELTYLQLIWWQPAILPGPQLNNGGKFVKNGEKDEVEGYLYWQGPLYRFHGAPIANAEVHQPNPLLKQPILRKREEQTRASQIDASSQMRKRLVLCTNSTTPTFSKLHFLWMGPRDFSETLCTQTKYATLSKMTFQTQQNRWNF